MDGPYLLRMGWAIVAAVIASAGTAGLLMLLPPSCAVATLFTGLILFLVGAKLHIHWATAMGGVLMFGSLFAAALLGALG